jgi:hypothetical protein
MMIGASHHFLLSFKKSQNYDTRLPWRFSDCLMKSFLLSRGFDTTASVRTA